MSIELPALPYAMDALEPHISKETLEFHYGKHHKTYVDKLNGLLPGTDFEGKSLVEIVTSSEGGMFNNAAQIWNHTFYWNCLSPNGGGEPTAGIAKLIDSSFGSFAEFKEAFTQSAINNFGSAWTWLVKKSDGSLDEPLMVKGLKSLFYLSPRKIINSLFNDMVSPSSSPVFKRVFLSTLFSFYTL
mgnify:CR=1 FL=1